MIITTNNLNNIETKITTPQIEGIEFIDAVLNENGIVTGINASYNDIMAIIENGKLPIIVSNGSNEKRFIFIREIFFDDPSYVVLLINSDNFNFIAENATTNMVINVTTPLG